MKYKLMYDPTKNHFEECCRVLKEGVRYKLLNYEEAVEKSKFIQRSGYFRVTYGYSSGLYEERKGDKHFVYLTRYNGDWRLKHTPLGFNVSIDMLEPYQTIIKYNKD